MPMPAAMSSFNLFTSLYALNSPSAGPVYSAGKEGRTKKMQKKGGERREERGGRRAEGGGRKDEGGERREESGGRREEGGRFRVRLTGVEE
jgi:hypothetical protein